LIAAALAAPVVLGGCQVPSFGAFHGATTQGQAAFKLWQGFFIAGLVIGGFVFVLILWAMFRYRKKSDKIPPQTQYHTAIEILYTVVPIIIVAFLFFFTVLAENKVTAISDGSHVTVNVTAFQWGWEFEYPQYSGIKVIGIETQAPEMVLPVGETVRVYLRSNDVIHGFYVPEFNYSQYAQPGRTNTFDMDILHTGTYRGQCTQFCGLYHSEMLFRVKAVTTTQFQSWTLQQKQTQISSSTPSISNLKVQAARGGY